MNLHHADWKRALILSTLGRLLIELGVLVGVIFAGAALLAPYSTKADLVGQFLLQGACVTVLVLAVTVLRADLLRSAVLVAALIVQASALRPDFTTPGAVARQAPTVRLLFANMLNGNQRKEEALEAILREDADIVVLAEILEDWPPAIRRLAGSYPYRADCFSSYRCDVIVLSRLPMVEPQLERSRNPRAYMALGEVQTVAGTLTVAGTHFRRPIPLGNLGTQMGQAKYLMDHLPKDDRPTVLVGDFNSVTWGRVISGIQQETGLVAVNGLEGTWPSQLGWPLRLPIDHVLLSDGVRLVERRVIDMPGSDHKSVVVDLAIREQDA